MNDRNDTVEVYFARWTAWLILGFGVAVGALGFVLGSDQEHTRQLLKLSLPAAAILVAVGLYSLAASGKPVLVLGPRGLERRSYQKHTIVPWEKIEEAHVIRLQVNASVVDYLGVKFLPDTDKPPVSRGGLAALKQAAHLGCDFALCEQGLTMSAQQMADEINRRVLATTQEAVC